jgi:lipoprotein-releasing system permease protein
VTWELMVGLRYLRSRRLRAGLSLISFVSFLGVMIGVATLVIVLAVMSGLEHELRDRILGFNPHVTVVSYGGTIDDWTDVVRRIEADPDVVAAAPVVYGQAMVGIGRNVSGVVVRGIDPKRAGRVLDLERHVVAGSVSELDASHEVPRAPDEGGGTVRLPGLMVGGELARMLGLAPGDVVNLISPLGTPTPAGMVPRIKRFVVVATFESGMFEYDTSLAYMSLETAQTFFDLGNGVSAIEVRVRDLYDATTVARRIERELGGFPLRARDWMEANRNLFSALKLEKAVYGIVLCLIVVVAAFNILATLTMVVKEKRRDIAILKSLGASDRSIGRIFVLKGAVIGLVGTLGGIVLGLTGCWILARYHFIQLPKDVFLVTTLPVRVEPLSVLVVSTVSILICVVAALSPARRAAGLVPVEVLRYE